MPSVEDNLRAAINEGRAQIKLGLVDGYTVSDGEIVKAISEMMANWSKAEAAARMQFPAATDDEIYQVVKSAMNRSLGL